MDGIKRGRPNGGKDLVGDTDFLSRIECGCIPTTIASTRPGWLSLPDVVHRFKTMTTTRYIKGVKRQGWRPFNKRLWQRNYYEHIIRNPLALGRIRRYILLNLVKWQADIVHPVIHGDLEAYYQQLFKNWEEGKVSFKGRLT